jgi:CheY-like chemotaxis protein
MTIRDSGTGLDEATQSRLFEPFFTAKRGVQGSGLSLPAVYGITSQHGGYIAVESERHRGTAFLMYLPAVAEAGAPAGGASTGPEGPRGTETILLVERNRDVCLLLRDILEPHGYRVLEASDLRAAQSGALAEAEPIHLVLLTSPSVNGASVPPEIVDARPGLKVLYMSGPAAANAGVPDPPGTGRLQKPFTVLSLLAKVRQLLDE